MKIVFEQPCDSRSALSAIFGKYMVFSIVLAKNAIILMYSRLHSSSLGLFQEYDYNSSVPVGGVEMLEQRRVGCRLSGDSNRNINTINDLKTVSTVQSFT